MHPEIDNLINMALADGEVTEKERNIILKKAISLGIDHDEVEMILDGRLHQFQSSQTKPSKEKMGTVSTCPSCGATIKTMTLECSDCGHEFSNIKSNKTITNLLEKLDSLHNNKVLDEFDIDERSSKIIANTPIPNSKEDLLEFLTVCCSQVGGEHYSTSSAWGNKGREALLKAKIIFRQDTATLNMLADFEKLLNNSKNKLRNAWIIILIVFAFLGMLLIYTN
jgi:hypothetical protein